MSGGIEVVAVASRDATADFPNSWFTDDIVHTNRIFKYSNGAKEDLLISMTSMNSNNPFKRGADYF